MQEELEAMNKIAKLLEPLDAAARARVLGWVINALDVPASARTGGVFTVSRNTGAAPSGLGFGFSTFAELFHAAGPKAEKEKALVAAYWIQRTSGVEQFASQQVNTELKHIGYGIGNITDALSQLIEERPSAVIQLKKEGSSKQARKVYKVTDAGIRRVSELVSSGEKESKGS